MDVRGSLAGRVSAVGPVAEIRLAESGLRGEVAVSVEGGYSGELVLACVAGDRDLVPAVLTLGGAVEADGPDRLRIPIADLRPCWAAGGDRLIIHPAGEPTAQVLTDEGPVVSSTPPRAAMLEAEVHEHASILGILSSSESDLASLFGESGVAGEGGLAIASAGLGGSWDEGLGIATATTAPSTYRVVLDGAIDGQGPLSVDGVREQVAARLGALGGCPAGDLAGNPTEPGWIGVVVTISAEGAVSATEPWADTTVDADLLGCIDSTLRSASFPAAEGSTRVELRIGFSRR